jgi:hypothetical protein
MLEAEHTKVLTTKVNPNVHSAKRQNLNTLNSFLSPEKSNDLLFHEALKLLAPTRMTKFSQCFGFDLTNTLTGNIEVLTYLF